jgi:hypothetical protein
MDFILILFIILLIYLLMLKSIVSSLNKVIDMLIWFVAISTIIILLVEPELVLDWIVVFVHLLENL